MQDLQVQTNITFTTPSVLQKYNTKQIQTLFIQFVESLEKKDDKIEPVILHKIDYKDLMEDEKEAYNSIKRKKLKDLKLTNI